MQPQCQFSMDHSFLEFTIPAKKKRPSSGSGGVAASGGTSEVYFAAGVSGVGGGLAPVFSTFSVTVFSVFPSGV